MKNPYFRFKQFAIRHDRCAMKVGTDGVLLGAWARVDGLKEVDALEKANALEKAEKQEEATCILDIGTGSGLIALMLAQRYQTCRVEGIDIDETSARQAKENVEEAGMSGRVSVSIKDFTQAVDEATKYDLIVSNPPFYTEDTKGGNTARDNARHCSSLPFETLVGNVAKMLAPNGLFSVIIPFSAAQAFIALCAEKKLYLSRRMNVRATDKKPFNRVLLEFRKEVKPAEIESLTLYGEENARSAEYERLTKDFYL